MKCSLINMFEILLSLLGIHTFNHVHQWFFLSCEKNNRGGLNAYVREATLNSTRKSRNNVRIWWSSFLKVV